MPPNWCYNLTKKVADTIYRRVSFILKPSCVTQNVLFFTKGFWPFVDQSFKKFEWLTSQSLIPQPRCMQALGSNFNSKSIYLLSSWVLALGKCEWPLVDSIILCPCTENKCERIHFYLLRGTSMQVSMSILSLFWEGLKKHFGAKEAREHRLFGPLKSELRSEVTSEATDCLRGVPVSRSNGKWSKTKIRSNSSGK